MEAAWVFRYRLVYVAICAATFILTSSGVTSSQERLKKPAYACDDLEHALAGPKQEALGGRPQLASHDPDKAAAPLARCKWFKTDQVVVVLRRKEDHHFSCLASLGYRNAMDEAFEDVDQPDCFWTPDDALRDVP
ncbi:hypothetical protein [Beijerinckia sp. L45]|uniref:hypothetical protein n=1 Tax=Beijerinckia sp. L45 TaxID=1641855 RepID=UPI00131ADA4F|nr:hypothetical protein [Beijerinckia sp. L45]